MTFLRKVNGFLGQSSRFFKDILKESFEVQYGSSWIPQWVPLKCFGKLENVLPIFDIGMDSFEMFCA